MFNPATADENEETENFMQSKKTLFSGVKPTGRLTLGNLIGAINNWKAYLDEYNCIFCVVDLHSITVKTDPEQLMQRSLEILATYVAAGLDPDKCTLFLQSHVPQHAQLSWALSCQTMFGELSRMTQFKDKSAKSPDNINAGLFTYPVLMAADILLYNADIVPVGDDQKQHVELTRDIANRVNSVYGDTFTLPLPVMPKVGARIMDLLEPAQKMGKSEEDDRGIIFILDQPDVIVKKLKRAVTDSEAQVRFSPEKPGVSNLMTIHSVAAGQTFEQIEQAFEGKGYGDFKKAVTESVIEFLRPVRERALELLDDHDHLRQIYTRGAQNAQKIAQATLDNYYDKIGFLK